MNIIMDQDDDELIRAKTGNWRQTHPWRARSNNSVGLLRHTFSYEQFNELVSLNEGDNDLGFVFMSHEDEMFNPCFEIGFNFYEQIKNTQEAVFQFCNLNELNASACVDEHGGFLARLAPTSRFPCLNSHRSDPPFDSRCRVSRVCHHGRNGHSQQRPTGRLSRHDVRDGKHERLSRRLERHNDRRGCGKNDRRVQCRRPSLDDSGEQQVAQQFLCSLSSAK